MKKIISRKAAKKMGISRYYTGKPCKRGHIAERTTVRSVCMHCRKIHLRKYRISNKNKIVQKKYAQSNKGKISMHKRYVKYYSSDRGKNIHIKNSTRYVNEKLKNDPIYRLIHNLRSRLYGYLTKKGERKNSSIKEDIGCSKKELKNHIEKLFIEEMNWKNYGKLWSIDHKKPISKFSHTNMNKANFYLNLQPMLIKDNIVKSNKY